MNRAPQVRLGVFAAIGATCLLTSVLGIAALNGGGSVRLGDIELMAIAAGYDRRAEAVLAASPPPPAALRESAERSRAAIAQYPYDSGAWLRLAYVDRLEHGRLTPEGLAALERSYDLVAVDPDFAIWRIAFALENTPALSRSALDSVRQEVSAVWSVYRYRAQLLKLRQELQNPGGRLALFLWVNSLQKRPAK